MNITIFAVGTRGDVQPYVALGMALQRAGHHVKMPAHETFRELITSHGITYEPVEGLNPQEFVQRPALQEAARRGNQLTLLLTMLRESGPLFEIMFEEFWRTAQGSDLILTTGIFFGAYDAAEKLGVPSIHATLIPFYPTTAFPVPLIPMPLPRLPWLNRLTYTLVEQAIWQPYRTSLNRWRQQRLGLPPHPLSGPFGQMRARPLPTLIGYSPSVVPRPSDWPATKHVTGYWFLEESSDWQPPADLLAFLEAGPPPVYVGFGSMADRAAAQMTSLVVEALELSGQRGILSAGWGGFGGQQLPKTIFSVGDIPHAWLFKHVAAVVHHVGTGTTGAGLRAGVPSVITPFLGDQFFWGKRVAALGVGPAPHPYHKLTVPALAERIQMAVSDQAMRQRAAALGARIAAEQGTAKAVALIEAAL